MKDIPFNSDPCPDHIARSYLQRWRERYNVFMSTVEMPEEWEVAMQSMFQRDLYRVMNALRANHPGVLVWVGLHGLPEDLNAWCSNATQRDVDGVHHAVMAADENLRAAQEKVRREELFAQHSEAGTW